MRGFVIQRLLHLVVYWQDRRILLIPPIVFLIIFMSEGRPQGNQNQEKVPQEPEVSWADAMEELEEQRELLKKQAEKDTPPSPRAEERIIHEPAESAEHGVMARIEADSARNEQERFNLSQKERSPDYWEKYNDLVEESAMLRFAKDAGGDPRRGRELLQEAIEKDDAHGQIVLGEVDKYLERIQRESAGRMAEEKSGESSQSQHQFLSAEEVDNLLKGVGTTPTEGARDTSSAASAVPNEVSKAALMLRSEWMDDDSLRKPMMPPPVIGAPDNIPLDNERESVDSAHAGSGEGWLPAGEILSEDGESEIPPIPLFPRMSRHTAPPHPAAQTKEDQTAVDYGEAGADARLDTEEGRRWLHGFLNPGKEIPDGFTVPEELREPAEVFLQRRDELLEAYGAEAQGWSGWQRIKNRVRHAAGRGMRDGEVFAREKYNAAYQNLQASIVRGYKMRSEREGQMPEEVRGKILEYASQALVQSVVSNDMAFERERVERMFGQKERGTMSRLWDSYQRMPRHYRIAMSAILSGGAGVALASGAGVAAALGYGGYRVLRTIGGGASAWGLQKAIDRFGIQKIFGRSRGAALADQQELTKIGLESIRVEDEANLSYLLDTINADAREYQAQLTSIGKQEKTVRILSGLIVGLGVGLAAGIALRPDASAAAGLAEPNAAPVTPLSDAPHTGIQKGAALPKDTGGSPKTSAIKRDSFPPQSKVRTDQSPGKEVPAEKPTPSAKVAPLEHPAKGKLQAAVSKEAGGPNAVSVRKGEGLWHPVKRQLAEHLRANPQKYHFKPEDLQDAKKVEAFLNRRTQKILMDAGKTEMGVRKPGLRVLLDEDDKLQQIDKKELYHRGGGVHEPEMHTKTHRGAGVDTTHTRRSHAGAGGDNMPAGRNARNMIDLMREREHSKEILRQAEFDAGIAGVRADTEHAATMALEAHHAARKAAESYLEKLGFSPRERTAWLTNRQGVTVGKVLKEIPEDYDIVKDGGASVDLPYQSIKRFGAVPRQIELARLMREAMKKSGVRLDRLSNPSTAIRDIPVEKFLEHIDPATRKLNTIPSP